MSTDRDALLRDTLLRHALGLSAGAPLALERIVDDLLTEAGQAYAPPAEARLERVLPVGALNLRGRLSRDAGAPGQFLLEDIHEHAIVAVGGAALRPVLGHPAARWLDLRGGGIIVLDGVLVLNPDGAIDRVAAAAAPAPPEGPRPADPGRPPAPGSAALQQLAAGTYPGGSPALQALIAPLVGLEAPAAPLRAVGFALRLLEPGPARRAAARAALRAGQLPPERQALIDLARGLPPALIEAAEAARADEAERLIDLLQAVGTGDDERCTAAAAAAICEARAAAAALDAGLRVAGRSPEPALARVDALGQGRLPWLREAVGEPDAAAQARWSAERAHDPSAWWADAMLGQE